MGWYIYPHPPGTQYGPCAEACQHIDCAKSRADAAGLCRFCHKAIGYGGRIYFEESGPVHADCLEKDTLAQNERVQQIIKIVDSVNQITKSSKVDLVDNITHAAPPASRKSQRLIYTPGYCTTFTTPSGATLVYHVWEYAGSWYLRRYDSASAIWKLSGLQIPKSGSRKYKSRRDAVESKARQLSGK